MDPQATGGQRRSWGGPLLLFGLILVLLAAAIWANMWKADLRIADVQVRGNLILEPREILGLAKIDKNQRLYDVDLLAAQQRVMKNAFVKSVAVNREAPNRIAITVKERVPIAAVVLDRMEYLDADGVVLPSARSENIFDLPVLTGSFQSAEFAPGKRMERPEVLDALEILAAAQLIGDDLYRRISEVHVDAGRDLILYTAEAGVPVVLTRSDLMIQLVKFDGFWKEIMLHHGAAELAYVDLRFEDQVVVRWNQVKDDVTPKKELTAKAARGKKT
jgi:cell division protein FtsQ